MSARLSVNHAYFHEALNGEFFAPSGPQPIRRTLARLLIETYENGEITNPNSSKEMRIDRPSWAPIDIAVHVSHWDIHCLTLASSERQLDFIHTLEGGSGRSLRVIDNANTVLEKPLGLGNGLGGRLQFLVARIAEDFFRSVTAAQVPNS